MPQSKVSRFVKNALIWVFLLGFFTSLFLLPAEAASAAVTLMERIAALPEAEEVVLGTALQYEVESIRWAYDTLTPASLKNEIDEASVTHLEAVEGALTELISRESHSSVTEQTALNWPQFMGNLGQQGVSDAKAATSGSQLVKKWGFNISKGHSDWAATPGTPIVVGEYAYCYIGEKLRKFRISDGLQVAKADAPGEPMFFINLAYGDGKVFVPRLTRGSDKKLKTHVVAYDAGTLEQLFVTKPFPSSGQAEGQTFYYNGYIYLSNYGQGGSFACYSTADKTPGVPDETVSPVWIDTVGQNDSFSANIGPAFVNGACIYATGGWQNTGTNSTVTVRNAKTGVMLQSFVLPGKEHVSSTLVYNEKNNRLYVPATNGDMGMALRSYIVNADGTLDPGSMRAFVSDVKSGGTQSSPVIYNDRLYIAGGGRTMGSQEPFRVLDANTLEEIYRIDALKSKGTACLITAYATEENNNTVYLYFLPYAPERKSGQGVQNTADYTSSFLWIIKDSAGQKAPSYEIVRDIGEPEYCSQSILMDKNGNLLFYNDAKGLYCYGNKAGASMTAVDVDRQLSRLPSPDTYPYYNQTEIHRLRERYNALSPSEKGKVKQVSRLEAAERTLALSGTALTAYAEQAIAALPSQDYSSDRLECVGFWARRAGFSSQTLALAMAEKNALLDQKAAEEVENAIGKLPAVKNLSTANEPDLDYVESLFGLLSKEQKNLVSNREIYTDARKMVDGYRKIMNEAIEVIDALFLISFPSSNAIDGDELLATVDSALADADAALETALTELPESDGAAVTEKYNAGRHEFLREKIILYVMEIKLTVGDVSGEGRSPVDVTKQNFSDVLKYSDMVQAHYARFSESRRESWNHEDDMAVAQALSAEAARFQQTPDGEGAGMPSDGEIGMTFDHSSSSHDSAIHTGTSDSPNKTPKSQGLPWWPFALGGVVCAAAAGAFFFFKKRGR